MTYKRRYDCTHEGLSVRSVVPRLRKSWQYAPHSIASLHSWPLNPPHPNRHQLSHQKREEDCHVTTGGKVSDCFSHSQIIPNLNLFHCVMWFHRCDFTSLALKLRQNVFPTLGLLFNKVMNYYVSTPWRLLDVGLIREKHVPSWSTRLDGWYEVHNESDHSNYNICHAWNLIKLGTVWENTHTKITRKCD